MILKFDIPHPLQNHLSLDVIRNRIDQFGVTEPVIVRPGKDEIVLQLPEVNNPERTIELVGRTAQLEFKLVDAAASLNLRELMDKSLRSGNRFNESHVALTFNDRGVRLLRRSPKIAEPS